MDCTSVILFLLILVNSDKNNLSSWGNPRSSMPDLYILQHLLTDFGHDWLYTRRSSLWDSVVQMKLVELVPISESEFESFSKMACGSTLQNLSAEEGLHFGHEPKSGPNLSSWFHFISKLAQVVAFTSLLLGSFLLLETCFIYRS